MQLSLTRHELAVYVQRQIDHFFPDGAPLTDLPRFVDLALGRVEHCFSRHRLKGYAIDGDPRFWHLHSDQYTVFLYYLANSAFRESPGHPLADKAYLLNKTLHGIDAFYEVQLPDIFAVQHPVGTVLGRGSYSDYFMCYQNCTVGANLDSGYPSFGRGVVMYGGSRIIGMSTIGANTLVAAGTVAIDCGEMQPDSVVFGIHPNIGRKPTNRNVLRDVFGAS